MFGLGGKVRLRAVLQSKPVSDKFGFDRGTPLDRHYIGQFLENHSACIRGHVLEVADNHYSVKYASGDIQSTVLKHNAETAPGVLGADLTAHDGLPGNAFDCFVCTQTFNFIYDFKAAIAGSHKLLKPGGTLLATLAALSPVSKYDADRWGDFWRFTPQSAERAFAEAFGKDRVQVQPFGNSAVAALFMKGYALEDLPASLRIDEPDALYPIVIGVRATK